MTDWSDLSGTFLTLSPTHRLELVLDMWIRLTMSQPELRQYTHARASFDWSPMGAISVRWSLLVADDDTIRAEKMVNLGPNGVMAVNGMVEPWTHRIESAISHGRLTFDFIRPSVGLDLFDKTNTTLFAHHLVKNGTSH